MFGKLLKYELKATYKWYLILFSILAVVTILSALIIGTTIQGYRVATETDYPDFGIFLSYTFLLMIFSSTVGGIGLSNTILIVVRFYRNTFGREGYLTWTLPVSNHQILLSKLLMAVFWTFLLGILTALSTLGLVVLGTTLLQVNLTEALNFLLALFWRADIFILATLFLLRTIFGAIAGILTFYLAMAIGHLFKNYRILMSILFGFLIVMASNTVNLFLPGANLFTPFNFFSSYFYENGFNMTYFNIGLAISVIIEIAKIIGFYLIIASICKKRLNLQ